MTLCIVLCLFQWQQRVSYEIKASLNTQEHSLSTVEYLTYYNNAPSSIETVYIHLYPNAYKDEKTIYAQEAKRMGDYRLAKSKQSERGYINIKNVIIEGDTLNYKIAGTLMIVPLPTPLLKGDSITLNIESYLKIPRQFSRLGFQHHHYEMVQWYPKMCVFDEDGWHLDAYHAIGEFYGEYACYDVEIELPGDYVVAATGERIDSLDIAFIDLLIKSGKKPEHGARKKVAFHAENVHDFTWVCDPDFLIKKYEIDGINVFIFYLKGDEKQWHNAGIYTLDAVKRYNRWYGKYPYRNLCVVDGYFHDGMEYPQMVIIGPGEDRFTRFFELVIIHEIGHQWFYGVLGSNEIDEAWLDEGFTTYTEIRYLEDKYGKENSLIKLPLFPPLSRRYYHKLIYYLTQTNHLEKPILTPAYEFIDIPIAYANSAYSKPALFLFNLEGIVGRERFDKTLKKYFQSYKFKHPKSKDFVKICEEVSGKDLKSIFHAMLNSTAYCDWSVKEVSGSNVVIENRGTINMPVDVLVEAESGAHVFRIDTEQRVYTIALPESSGRAKKVTVDPYGYSLEPNYWNNYYPKKLKIKPIFSLPSFDSYQILFLPYLWYGAYDGVSVGMYLLGTQFVDFDFVRGSHQWTAGCVYGTKSKKLYPGFSYQTPIIFKKNVRTRIIFKGSNSNGEDKLRGGIASTFGVPFSRRVQIGLSHMLSYYDLRSYFSVDSMDWDFGKNIVFENHLNFKYLTWYIDIGLSATNKVIGSEFNYLKATFETKKQIDTPIPVNIRFFVGKILGDAPGQEKLFLNGVLRISMLADIIFGQAGDFSPQGHIHIPGDGNMLGYQTLHIKSEQMCCINLEFPHNSPIRMFTDFGYYDKFAFDVGACLVLGPVSFNVPFYILSDQPWKIRWSIGF
jgi:hypothetical protein